MDYFKKGVTAPDTSASHVKWDFSGLSRGDVWVRAVARRGSCWSSSAATSAAPKLGSVCRLAACTRSIPRLACSLRVGWGSRVPARP